jgi:4-amino-4-deoxy-L-arabinose transferase-like glycosyltransferase
MTSVFSRLSFRHYLLIVFIGLLITRLLSLGAYPLVDSTEARYAEMARKMLETGNWVTPLFDYGVPFWGKPPLSFWASAATMGLFGVNEFAARLAPFLCSLLVIALFWAWPRPEKANRDLPLGAAIVFLSSVAGFIATGAVMTDMFMTLATTLSMVAFWQSINQPIGASKSYWRWLFFVGLGIGLLAKGPVAPVLTLLAIGLWVFWQRAWLVTWQRLPWLYGSLLTLAIAVPWYVIAEMRTPGFLQYFIIGEHWQRYVNSGWKGDLYGTSHAEPHGAIWLYGFAVALPWSLIVVLAALRNSIKAKQIWPKVSSEVAYLLCWIAAPLLFFTLAGNILPVYALPAIPAFALFASYLLLPKQLQHKKLAWSVWSAAWLLPLFAVWVLAAHLDRLEQRSQRTLMRANTSALPVVYIYKRPYSASFYSSGQAIIIKEPDEISRWLSGVSPAVIVLPEWRMKHLPSTGLKLWEIKARNDGYVLLTMKR